MDLKILQNPNYFTNLSLNELKTACNEIRGKIINVVSDKGGYLSSNLSIVEITAALYKVFNDTDKIVYSGPNTNYANRFINGLEMLNEEYNNALSNSLGLAISRDINHDNYNVISVINSDSAFSNSNFEALNNISLEHRKMIIVFNDDTSIDKGIGIVDKFISNIRNTKTYTNIKDNVKDFIRPQKGGDKIIEGIHNLKSNIKKAVVNEGVFKEYNIDYIGPIDGHNLDELVRAFDIAKTKEYPCVVHCITTKGKGYVYAESNTNEAWYKTCPFDIKTGKKFIEESDEYKSCIKLISESLLNLMNTNDKLIIVSPDNKNEFKLTQLFAKHPDRCYDSGQGINNGIGFACGFSLDDKIPVICLKSSNLNRGYDTICKQVDNLNKPFILFLNRDCDDDLPLLNSLENSIIFNISNYDDIDKILLNAIESKHPYIIRYTNNLFKINNQDNTNEINVGKWDIVANNDVMDIAIITDGQNVDNLNKLIIDNDYKYKLINSNYINPIDLTCIDYLNKINKIYLYKCSATSKILKYLINNKNTIKIIDDIDTKEFFNSIETDINA